MKIIVGLGNPGKEYENTRHNVGYMFLDALVGEKEIAPVGETVSFKEEKKFDSLIAESLHKGDKVLLVKPLTFMNSSGMAVLKVLQFHKTGLEDLIVVSDDVDLPIGTVRIRLEGSSGGHKGLQNIIDQLGDDIFVRVRIGVSGDQEKRDLIETKEYVLGRFTDREIPKINQAIEEAVEYIMPFIGSKEPIPAHTIEVKFDSMQ